MKPKPGYIKTKIGFCTTTPFIGLGELGMWYGHALESEIKKWETDSRTARLGDSEDKAALCSRHDGFQIRRVSTDGKLLRVYNPKKNQVTPNSLLPIAVLGDYIEIVDIPDVPSRLQSMGGYRCEFAIDGISHTGYILPGKQYCAAWTDDERGWNFVEQGKNPNGRIIRKLDPSA